MKIILFFFALLCFFCYSCTKDDIISDNNINPSNHHNDSTYSPSKHYQDSVNNKGQHFLIPIH